MTRRVVITGLGLVTPVGNTVEDTWAALLNGRSGADYIKKFDAERFSVKFACEVKNFDPLTFIAKKEARKMGAFIHYAIAASIEAMADSGIKLTPEGKFPDDIAENAGTYISSGIGDFWAIEREHSKLLDDGPDRVSPFFIVSAIVNLAAGQVSIRFGAKGPNSATATACSAGAHAIGDSFKIIQRGDADIMICGGAESAITPMSVAGFSAMRALSTNNDDPLHASRPFERDRDGFVIGEGAGITLDMVTPADLGKAKKIVVTQDGTTIVGARGRKAEVEARAGQIRALYEATNSTLKHQQLNERLRRLVGGAALIRVGGTTDPETRERTARIEDAMFSVRAAIKEGVLVGGGVARGRT